MPMVENEQLITFFEIIFALEIETIKQFCLDKMKNQIKVFTVKT
jgi:hypothetical protein